MKKIFIIIAIVVAGVVILSLTKDLIIKVSVEKAVKIVTGLRLDMGSFGVGILRPAVGIKNLKLFNPPGYKDRTMLDMPEIYIRYDLGSAMKGKVHLEEARINVKELLVVKNELGELNLDSLKAVQAQKTGRGPSGREKARAPEMRIDTLDLKIGKAVYKDYSGGGEPSIKEFEINIDERYSDITDLNVLVSLIVVKALTNTSIANLTNFDLNGLQGTLSDTLSTAQKAMTNTVTRMRGVVGKGPSTVTETAKETEAVVKEAAGALKDIFSAPFGSKKE